MWLTQVTKTLAGQVYSCGSDIRGQTIELNKSNHNPRNRFVDWIYLVTGELGEPCFSVLVSCGKDRSQQRE
jgi:hypothetical protein